MVEVWGWCWVQRLSTMFFNQFFFLSFIPKTPSSFSWNPWYFQAWLSSDIWCRSYCFWMGNLSGYLTENDKFWGLLFSRDVLVIPSGCMVSFIWCFLIWCPSGWMVSAISAHCSARTATPTPRSIQWYVLHGLDRSSSLQGLQHQDHGSCCSKCLVFITIPDLNITMKLQQWQRWISASLYFPESQSSIWNSMVEIIL